MRLILASQSPRRLELLERAGYQPIVRVSGVPEEHRAGESPREYVVRLARKKAEAVPRQGGEVVLGADTVVVQGGSILEKPIDAEDARRMLSMLSGNQHRVITGICILHDSGMANDAEETIVRFSQMSGEEIDEYVRSGEPMDKAGAYAIQGLASKFIDRIEGDYANVVGLPVSMVYRYLRDI